LGEYFCQSLGKSMTKRCLGRHRSHTSVPPFSSFDKSCSGSAWPILVESFFSSAELTNEIGDAFLAGAGLVLGRDPSVLQPRTHPQRPFNDLRSSYHQLRAPKNGYFELIRRHATVLSYSFFSNPLKILFWNMRNNLKKISNMFLNNPYNSRNPRSSFKWVNLSLCWCNYFFS
jgi:hypothetical protein